jgi:nicotinamidase-related amidase
LRVNDRYVSFYYEPDEDIGKIEIVPEKTALLVIDMQNVFVQRPSKEGLGPKAIANWERWQPFYDRIDSMVTPNIKKLLDLFRAKGIEVIFARITCHKKDGRDRSLDQKATGFNELLLPPGAPAGEIIKELAPIEDEIVVTKTTDSALTGTNLRLILHNMGLDTVIATGVFTDQCVSCTVRSLADESFNVYLIEDACMAATEEIQKHELEVLNNIYCHVINTEELLEAIK